MGLPVRTRTLRRGGQQSRTHIVLQEPGTHTTAPSPWLYIIYLCIDINYRLIDEIVKVILNQ